MSRRLCFWFCLTALAALAATAPSVTECRGCHRAQTERFALSGMAQALVNTGDADVLHGHSRLTAQLHGYSYEIDRSGSQVIYSVTDGKDTIRAAVDWAFGSGGAGQTFVFQREGRWYESRVSYFSALDGLDYTMGAQNTVPRNLDEASGRRMTPSDTADCFGCHATRAVKNSELTLPAMAPGVQCEACHGAADQHLRAVRSGEGMAAMRKLGSMSSEEMSEFCGRCHRTWSLIAANGPRGMLNVRFQPYRMELSKCYDPDDKRIRCTACHNPHAELETSTRAYDAKCVACHSAASGKVCRVAKRDCVTCHMPKVELPGAHKKFTDHRIRIAKAGDRYPD
jgi:hypothetical protein